jgi:hypothetical protein
MNDKLRGVLDHIETEYEEKIQRGSRHYVEVSIGQQASALGFTDLGERYEKTFAVVPLREPQRGMKVRIDGRTFVDYAEYDSGIAVPGYLAREVGSGYRTFVPQDSMICNFS